MRTLRGVRIVADQTNEAALRYEVALKTEFVKRGVLIAPYKNPKNDTLVIVLGGDGTMLKTAHSFNFGPTFLGLNLGHKGYLMNKCDPAMAADRILDREFKMHQFSLLEIEAQDGKMVLAMGDVYFNRISGITCKVSLKIDGIVVDERISGDGIVIATALGSSGYFTPAKGSAIHPKLPVICFAPVIPNTPFRITSMVVPSSSVLEVDLLSPPEEVRGWYDAIDLPYFRKITIRKSRRNVKLAFWKGENFTRRLVDKIMRA